MKSYGKRDRKKRESVLSFFIFSYRVRYFFAIFYQIIDSFFRVSYNELIWAYDNDDNIPKYISI